MNPSLDSLSIINKDFLYNAVDIIVMPFDLFWLTSPAPLLLQILNLTLVCPPPPPPPPIPPVECIMEKYQHVKDVSNAAAGVGGDRLDRSEYTGNYY